MSDCLDLSTNVNRWGAPPSAVAFFTESAARIWSYPEPDAESLRRAIASHLKVRPEEVTTGCGSDGVLSAAIRATTNAGDRIALPTPTFPMVAQFALDHGLDVAEVPLTASYEPDVPAMLATRPRIAYLCAPNNPTGTRVSREQIALLARGVELLIVDQAYAEFDETAEAPRAQERILWLRTMSKAFGLAGARVGYAVGTKSVVDLVERVRGPYVVSEAGGAAASYAIRRDRSWMRECAELAVRSRERLTQALADRGLDPVRSFANFVFLPLCDAETVAAEMRKRGVRVRVFQDLARVSPALETSGGDALRISVGPWLEMERALNVFDAARSALACV